MTDATAGSPQPIPPEYRTLTPYLVVHGAGRLLDFLVQAFDARILHRAERPDGTVGHGEVEIGDSRLMLGEASPEWPAMPTMLYMYVADCDASYRRALAAGARSLQEPEDKFYGDRNAAVADPAGNTWCFASRVEELTVAELQRREAASVK